jgi:hypothetical protein
MLLTILGFITGLGPIISNIGGKYLDLQRRKEDAKNNKDIAEINAEISAIQDRRAVLVAEAASRLGAGINASVRLLAALPGILFVWKILFWDKVIGSFYGCAGRVADGCGSFRTDSIEDNMWWLIIAIFSFYFLASKWKT